MMKTGEECGYCATLLDVHCTLHGQEFCDIKEQYWTDPTMGIDAVYDRLLDVATPQQINEARRMVKQREAQGIPPVQVPDPPTDPPRDSLTDHEIAQAMAQRWLDHWQHGKEA